MMKVLSNIVSFLFHPLLMTTYGMILALYYTYLVIYPLNVKLALIGGTFLTTALIPGIFIYLLIKSGSVGDVEISQQKDRAIPYLIIIISLTSCFYFLYRMKMPFWVLAAIAGIGISLLIALCINFFWKISVHSLGMGGLLGGVMSFSRIQGINPYWLFISIILIAGLMATSRIYLKRHSPMQTYAGTALGFLTIFGAIYLNYLYLLN